MLTASSDDTNAHVTRLSIKPTAHVRPSHQPEVSPEQVRPDHDMRF